MEYHGVRLVEEEVVLVLQVQTLLEIKMLKIMLALAESD